MTTELPKPADRMSEVLGEIVAYCREAGHDWSNLDEAEALLAAGASKPTAQVVTDEREAFEAWATSVGYHTERDMFQREKYQSSVTWELWRVWQARAALSLPAAEPMTPAQRIAAFSAAHKRMDANPNLAWRDAIVIEVEAHHGIGKGE